MEILLHYFSYFDYHGDMRITQPKKLQIRVDGKKHKLKIKWNLELSEAFNDSSKTNCKVPDLIIAGFSLIKPPYEKVYKKFCLKNCFFSRTLIPIILLGDEANERINTEELEDQTSIKKGEQLARRIKAVKYMEYPYRLVDDILKKRVEDGFLAEIDWARFRREKIKLPSKTFTKAFPLVFNVVGFEESGKMDLIRRFVFGDRLNVVGECLNEQPYFYGDNKSSRFSTFIEIDGEEHNLFVENITIQNPSKPVLFQSVGRSNNLTLTFVVFSVVQPETFKTLKLVNDISLILDYSSFALRKAILIGYQTELRNDPETVKKLTEQNKHPITYEMGEQIAREFHVAKYVECSGSDNTEIENIFEEAVWSLLRYKERNRIETPKKNRKKFKTFFGIFSNIDEKI